MDSINLPITTIQHKANQGESYKQRWSPQRTPTARNGLQLALQKDVFDY
jgi:hypothetical protein